MDTTATLGPGPLPEALTAHLEPYGLTLRADLTATTRAARGALLWDLYRAMYHVGNPPPMPDHIEAVAYADSPAAYRDRVTHHLVTDLVMHLRTMARADPNLVGPNDYLAVVLDAVNAVIHSDDETAEGIAPFSAEAMAELERLHVARWGSGSIGD